MAVEVFRDGNKADGTRIIRVRSLPGYGTDPLVLEIRGGDPATPFLGENGWQSTTYEFPGRSASGGDILFDLAAASHLDPEDTSYSAIVRQGSRQLLRQRLTWPADAPEWRDATIPPADQTEVIAPPTESGRDAGTTGGASAAQIWREAFTALGKRKRLFSLLALGVMGVLIYVKWPRSWDAAPVPTEDVYENALSRIAPYNDPLATARLHVRHGAALLRQGKREDARSSFRQAATLVDGHTGPYGLSSPTCARYLSALAAMNDDTRNTESAATILTAIGENCPLL